MSKKCDKCGEEYKGFGLTCAVCRKRPSQDGNISAAPKGGGVKPDHCEACGKKVYAMEAHHVEGSLFHKDCFKCTTCGRKLAGSNFGKNELGFFCLTHFHQIAKVTGGYKTGSGPTRNAAAASLVEAMLHRGTGGGGAVCPVAAEPAASATAAPATTVEVARAAEPVAQAPAPVPVASAPAAAEPPAAAPVEEPTAVLEAAAPALVAAEPPAAAPVEEPAAVPEVAAPAPVAAEPPAAAPVEAAEPAAEVAPAAAAPEEAPPEAKAVEPLPSEPVIEHVSYKVIENGEAPKGKLQEVAAEAAAVEEAAKELAGLQGDGVATAVH